MLPGQGREHFRERQIQRHRHHVVHHDTVGACDVRPDLGLEAADERAVLRREHSARERGEVALDDRMA